MLAGVGVEQSGQHTSEQSETPDAHAHALIRRGLTEQGWASAVSDVKEGAQEFATDTAAVVDAPASPFTVCVCDAHGERIMLLSGEDFHTMYDVYAYAHRRSG